MPEKGVLPYNLNSTRKQAAHNSIDFSSDEEEQIGLRASGCKKTSRPQSPIVHKTQMPKHTVPIPPGLSKEFSGINNNNNLSKSKDPEILYKTKSPLKHEIKLLKGFRDGDISYLKEEDQEYYIDGYVSKTVRLMRLHKKELAIHFIGSQVFERFANAKNSSRILSLGAAKTIAPALLQALRLCVESKLSNPKICAQVFITLRALSMGMKTNRDRLLQEGVTFYILQLLQIYSNHSDVQIHGIRALISLTRDNSDAKNTLIRLEVVPTMFNSMLTFAQPSSLNVHVQQKACVLLQALCHSSYGRKKAVIEAALGSSSSCLVFSRILMVYSNEDGNMHFEEHYRVQSSVFSVLASIAINSDATGLILRNHLHRKVITLLEGFVRVSTDYSIADELRVRYFINGLMIFRNLAKKNKPACIELKKCAAPQVVHRILQSSTITTIQETAKEVLTILRKNGKIKKRVKKGW